MEDGGGREEREIYRPKEVNRKKKINRHIVKQVYIDIQ